MLVPVLNPELESLGLAVWVFHVSGVVPQVIWFSETFHLPAYVLQEKSYHYQLFQGGGVSVRPIRKSTFCSVSENLLLILISLPFQAASRTSVHSSM